MADSSVPDSFMLNHDSCARDGHELADKLKFVMNFHWLVVHKAMFVNGRTAMNFHEF